MKQILTILLSISISIVFSQDCAEFQQHLNSIDSTFNTNRAFVDYTIDHLLIKPNDKCFISNRNLLRKLNTTFCDSSKVIIEDTLKNGEICKISISTDVFKPNKHKIISNEYRSAIENIDGQFPYGGQYVIPTIEIKEIKIEVDKKTLIIPTASFGNLFQPNLCDSYGFIKPIEVYESLNGDYIYMYIYGGNAAGTYFAKLIFNKTNYVTKIVSDYYPLSIHASFRASFIGF